MELRDYAEELNYIEDLKEMAEDKKMNGEDLEIVGEIYDEIDELERKVFGR
jgi:hypothetical protein